MTLVAARADHLRRTILNCTSCNLHLYCSSPTPPTIPKPPTTPELLIIGEAPGSMEERKGEPFVGPAGTLFFRWLKIEMGLARAQCMVINAASCRPTVANKRKVNRAPSKDELFKCRDNLARQLDYYARYGGSRWVLLLGATALGAMLPDARITQYAGRPFVLKHPTGLLNCYPMYHPAAALRDPNYSTTIRKHLGHLDGLRRDSSLWPEECFCGKEVATYDGLGLARCEEHRGTGRLEVTAPMRRMEQGRLGV